MPSIFDLLDAAAALWAGLPTGFDGEGPKLAMAVLGAHGGPIPEDIQTRSYFMNGLCGPGTTRSPLSMRVGQYCASILA